MKTTSQPQNKYRMPSPAAQSARAVSFAAPASTRALPLPGRLIIATAGLLTAFAAVGSATVIQFEAIGNAGAISGQVTAFRNQLGALNAPGACSPTPCTSGRREVNWDAVPVGSFNPFPGNFFNNDGTIAGRTRGLTITPAAGNTLQVDTDSNQFGFPGNFPSFSPSLIFAVVGNSALMDITFSVPGQPANAAYTSGFGIIFMDVETVNTTRVRYYNTDGVLVHTQFALADTITGGVFSFVGAAFTTERIARVEVVAGSQGFCVSALDCVAMDDFIYGEPQAINSTPSAVPEPATVSLSLVGLGAVLLARHRRDAGKTQAAHLRQ